MNPPGPEVRRGQLSAVLAYSLWGVFPMYWRQLGAVPAVQLIAWRVALSWALLVVLVALGRRVVRLLSDAGRARVLGTHSLSGALLAANWLTFVWAVNSGRILDASLGYYLTPLCNVLLGVVVLGERLTPLRWAAVALATCGVLVPVWQLGKPPWVALALAGTFSVYGLVRKQSPLESLAGLTLETTLLAPVAVGLLLWWESTGTGALHTLDTPSLALLSLAGVVTATPLLLFATAARRLPLATLALFQYIAPSVQLLVGVGLFAEVFDGPRALSFGLIWAGLAASTVEGRLGRPRL